MKGIEKSKRYCQRRARQWHRSPTGISGFALQRAVKTISNSLLFLGKNLLLLGSMGGQGWPQLQRGRTRMGECCPEPSEMPPGSKPQDQSRSCGEKRAGATLRVSPGEQRGCDLPWRGLGGSRKPDEKLRLEGLPLRWSWPSIHLPSRRGSKSFSPGDIVPTPVFHHESLRWLFSLAERSIGWRQLVSIHPSINFKKTEPTISLLLSARCFWPLCTHLSHNPRQPSLSLWDKWRVTGQDHKFVMVELGFRPSQSGSYSTGQSCPFVTCSGLAPPEMPQGHLFARPFILWRFNNHNNHIPTWWGSGLCFWMVRSLAFFLRCQQ